MNAFKLIASGEAFDVDAFVASTTLRPDDVWRRGDQRRYSCVESRHTTSGVEFVLGDGLSVPFLKQEGIAVAYLKAHRDELRALARFPGVESFTLGLQCRMALESNVIAFGLDMSANLMWNCLDVGCEASYYVTLDRLAEGEVEDVKPGAVADGGNM
jgi:hypothetical protein